MMARVLRAAAVAIAAAGVVDPACEVASAERPSISLQVLSAPSMALPAANGVTRQETADGVQRMLADRLARDYDVILGPRASADVQVLIGDGPPDAWTPDLAAPSPTFAVGVGAAIAPNVRIVRAQAPARISVWDSALVSVEIDRLGVEDTDAMVTLAENGAPMAAVRHRWPYTEAQLSFLPGAPGLHRLDVRISSSSQERTTLDNGATLLVETHADRRRVLLYQPRPSWMATFVARALEEDPRLELSSLVRASPGLETISGHPPGTVLSDVTGRFDALVVGAPEELTRAEVDALRRYARVRGGTVILLLDRRPAGAALALSPAAAGAPFDEVLLDRAAELDAGLRASELVVARRVEPGWETIAAAPAPGGMKRPVVLSRSEGRGSIVFSGALDAWRHRAGSRYWRDLVAAFAARTPPPVGVRLEPSVARPGERVEIVASVSDPGSAALAHERARSPLPSARLDDGTGVTLWPGGEPDIFRGEFRASGEGARVVTVERGAERATAALIVAADVMRPTVDRRASLEAIAIASGGAYADAPTEQHPPVASAAAFERLVARLKQAAQPRRTVRLVRPMQSAWWMLPFALLLGAEWTLRRRRYLH